MTELTLPLYQRVEELPSLPGHLGWIRAGRATAFLPTSTTAPGLPVIGATTRGWQSLERCPAGQAGGGKRVPEMKASDTSTGAALSPAGEAP